MKIAICGSITAAQEIIKTREELVKLGHEVSLPLGVINEYFHNRTDLPNEERAEDKMKNDVIREYYKVIKESDAILVVNPDKRGVKNYIGGNTLMEIGFAYILRKKIYCIYDVPKMQYTSEILAMEPIVIRGNLSLIK